jgi:hypothetical protein
MSSSIKVSDDFMSFYGKETEKIEQVKQAEARTGNVPFDLGTEGMCIVTGFELGKSQAKEQKDKTIKPGCPFGRLTFTVVDNIEHDGKEFPMTFWFWENDKNTRADTFKNMLDFMEKRMGMPREVRMNYTHPSELGKYFIEGNQAFRFKVVEDAGNTYDDNKKILVDLPKDFITADDSVAPPTAPQHSPAASSSAPVMVPGTIVKYLEMDWKVKQDFGAKIEIVGVDDPRMNKIVAKDLLDKA